MSESRLITASGEIGYVRLDDGSITTGRRVREGVYEVPSLMSPPVRIRPLTREDVRRKARMVQELKDRFAQKLAFWGGLRPLHVPGVCEPEFEAAASEAGFLLLGDTGASTLTSPLSRSTMHVPVPEGYLSITALPAFQMEEAEDGYRVDFGHLRPTQEGGWVLRNHNFVKPSNGATYFRIQR